MTAERATVATNGGGRAMRRLRGVVLDASAVVDRHGAPFGDVEPSLLAAQEAGLAVVLVADPDGPPVAPALERVRTPPAVVAARPVAARLRGALREAGLSPDATLHVAATSDALAAGTALGLRTAWLNRAGTAGDARADEEWRDLLALVALCSETPPAVRSEPRC